MKRKIIIMALTAMLVVGACGTKKSDSSTKFGATSNSTESDESQIVLVHGDRVIYDDLNSLIGASDLVVIGEFIEDGQEKITTEYNSQYEKDVVVNAETTNTLKIEKVFQGNVNVGDEIQIKQRYGHDPEKGNLISFSEMTPMIKGEKWIYFLYKIEEDDETYYYTSGDYTGRYPVSITGERNAKSFGVYENYNELLYEQILEKYELK